jgi:hypothetical protein
VICDGVPVWKQPGHDRFSLGYKGDASRGLIGVGVRVPAGAQECVLEVALANEKMQPVTETRTIRLF